MIDMIKRFDSMGKEFKFTINGGSYRTLFGGIISIFKAVSFLILCWYYGQDIYERKAPLLLKKETMLGEYPQVKLNSSFFNFAIRVENIEGLTIDDPSIFYYDVIWQQWELDENELFQTTDNFTIDMETCSTAHYDNDTLYHYKLFNYKCIQNNYTMGGDWGDSLVRVPNFFVRRCNKEAELKFNVVCKTDAEIIELYGNFFIDTYTQKNVLNPSDFKKPVQDTYNYKYKEFNFLDKNVVKQKIVYSTAKLTTDTGLIFEDLSYEEFLEYESIDVDFSPPQVDLGEYITSVEFYVSRNYRSYSRVFKKFSDALADVGGIMSFFSLIIDTLFTFYIDNSFAVFLQRKLVKLEKLVEDNPGKNEEIQLVVNDLGKDIQDKKNNGVNNNKSSLKKSEHRDLDDEIKVSIDVKMNNLNKDLNISKDILLREEPLKVKENIENIHEINKENKENEKIKEDVSTKTKTANKPKPFLFQLRKFEEFEKAKDIVLNKEINNILEYKKLNLQEQQISTVERFFFTHCCFNSKTNIDNVKILKFNFFNASNREISRKTDALDLIKLTDQFKLIKKIILNENQCFMLQKRGLKEIINTKIISEEEEDIQEVEKEKENIKKLINYMNKKNNDDSLSPVDLMLFNYMDPALKTELKETIKFI